MDSQASKQDPAQSGETPADYPSYSSFTGKQISKNPRNDFGTFLETPAF